MAGKQQEAKKPRKMNPNSLANLRANANPGGRPKASDEYKALVKANTVQAMQTVIDLMRNSPKEDIRLKAAQEVIDRAYGKAAQPIVGDKEFDPMQINYADAALVEARINELIAKRSTGT
jgi:hypothetical protein